MMTHVLEITQPDNFILLKVKKNRTFRLVFDLAAIRFES